LGLKNVWIIFRLGLKTTQKGVGIKKTGIIFQWIIFSSSGLFWEGLKWAGLKSRGLFEESETEDFKY